MSSKYKSFVGRDYEIELVQKMLVSNLPKALFFIGAGGVGKTRLLQQLFQTVGDASGIVAFPIIDFDETSYRTEIGIFDGIAKVHLKEFAEYKSRREDFKKILASGVSQARILEEEKLVKSVFYNCYNSFVQDQCGLVLFDTVEIMAESSLWTVIVDALKELNNTLIIMAGRGYGRAKHVFESAFGVLNVVSVNLDPFSQEDANDYFNDLSQNLDTELRRRLYILTGGRPILLALAVEWLGRDKPFPEIYKYSAQDLSELQQDEREGLIRKFEEALVNQFLEPRELLDNIIIQMAFIHRRFDEGVLSHLMNISPEKSNELIIKLQSFPFVKVRPFGISLHDEMRVLINQYIWPRLDPLGLERKQIAIRIVEYYKYVIEQLRLSGDDIFWLYRVEELFYELKVNLEVGFSKFKEYVEVASLAYHPNEIDLLLNEMEAVKSQFSKDKQFAIDILDSRNLLDRVFLVDARNKLDEMLKAYESDLEKIEILILHGNVDIRLGNALQAIDVVEEAYLIALRINSEIWMGKAELALGWFYRIRGIWSKAFEYYEKSLNHTISSGDKVTLGLIFNNLAYITEFSGDHISALGYSEQALRFFEEMGAIKQTAMCFSTLGEIYVYAGNYQKGLEYYQQAFDAFQKQNDLEFLGLVHSQLSRTLLELNQLDEAVMHGKKGVELCQSYSLQNLPLALHRLGRTYERIGYIKQAIDCYIQGQRTSEVQENSRYVMEHTVYLSHVYYQLWVESNDNLEKNKYLSLIQSNIEIFEREAVKGVYIYPQDYLFGRIKILLGNIQYDLKNYDAAIEIYKIAYYHIIIGSSETYTANELKKFSDRLERLPGHIALSWIESLEGYWSERNIINSKPQAANFCKKHKISALLSSR